MSNNNAQSPPAHVYNASPAKPGIESEFFLQISLSGRVIALILSTLLGLFSGLTLAQREQSASPNAQTNQVNSQK